MAPLTGKDFHNPKLTGPRASHNIPSGGVFSAYASTRINVSPHVVYDTLLNVAEWKEWNSFVYDVKITKTSNPHERKDGAHKRMTGGTCMIFYRNMTFDPPKKMEVRVVVGLVEKLKLSSDGHSTPCVTRVRWMVDNAAYSTPSFLLRSEQINEIEEADDGTTIYRTWAVFAGPVAKILRKSYEPAWRDRLQESAVDLKKRCERTPDGGNSRKPDQGQDVVEGGQTVINNHEEV